MNVSVQMSMVINLDKCLACHACSLPCKSAWNAAPGTEYIWFNNVEKRPGSGYPEYWENQRLHKGGWERHKGRLRLRSGGRAHTLAFLFTNPHLPPLSDYYPPCPPGEEPGLPHRARRGLNQPIRHGSGQPLFAAERASHGQLHNLADLRDPNFEGFDAREWLLLRQAFMLHLPRLCEHCLHPACVAACPSGALHKRPEDGIVLADESRCEGWRFCLSSCPYKKVYFNWRQQRARKCTFCHERLAEGQPALCVQHCPNQSRHTGLMLYDADAVEAAASATAEHNLYKAQLGLFLNPHDPAVCRAAAQKGLDETVMEAARRSPVWKLAAEWKLALPLHPEFRTLPMVWYVPPTSPLRAGAPEPDQLACTELPGHMRIPLRFLASLFTAGDEVPVRTALARLVALRRFMRQQTRLRPRGTQQAASATMQPAVAESWRWEVTPPSPDVLHDLASVNLDLESARAIFRLLSLANHSSIKEDVVTHL